MTRHPGGPKERLLREASDLADALAEYRAGASAAVAALERGDLDELERCLDAREAAYAGIEARLTHLRERMSFAGSEDSDAQQRISVELERCVASDAELEMAVRRGRERMAAQMPHARQHRTGYELQVSGGWVDRRI